MKEEGSSLMELIIVIAIISIVSSITVVTSSVLKRYDLDASAYQLATDLKFVQQLSINTSVEENEFSPAEMDQFPKLSLKVTANCGYIISRGLKNIKSVTFSKNIKIVGGYSAIYFNRHGYINQPITIRLENGEKTRLIIIDRVGRIRTQ